MDYDSYCQCCTLWPRINYTKVSSLFLFDFDVRQVCVMLMCHWCCYHDCIILSHEQGEMGAYVCCSFEKRRASPPLLDGCGSCQETKVGWQSTRSFQNDFACTKVMWSSRDRQSVWLKLSSWMDLSSWVSLWARRGHWNSACSEMRS
jgi:hypothetical protein